MPQITVHRAGEIQQRLLGVLASVPEGLQAKDALERVASSLILSDFEKAEYPNRPGVRRFEKLVRFSTIPLVKAGWMAKNKGIWTITDEGRASLKQYPDPESLRKASVAKYRQWVADQPESPESEVQETPSSLAVATLEEAEENAWAEIYEHLAKMSPYDLQELMSGLLYGMGYFVSYVSPPGPDQGIDIVAHRDPLGIQPPRIKVQVKRRADKINVDGIRSFLAVLGEGDAGIFVSTGGFTSDAERETRSQEKRKLMLLDAERLFDLWVEHYAKIPDDKRQLMPLKPIYYLNLER